MNNLKVICFILLAVICTVLAAPVQKITVVKCNSERDCSRSEYSSKLLAQKGNEITSEFGTRRVVKWDDDGREQKTDHYVLHHTASSSDGWAKSETNFAKVGVREYSGSSFGAGVDATLVEIGGKVGHGPVSIGGKLGVSADTGLVVGRKTELKFLGTGLGFSPEDGLSVCLIGSCISVG